MFSSTVLFYILIGSLAFTVLSSLIQLRKFKTWIKTKVGKRPMEEIAYLLFGTGGDASYVYVSGGANKVPIGRVIMGDNNDSNAYIDLLISDYEDESVKPQYRSCGYITPEGYIYRKLSSGKKPELIGFTAKPSAPDIPTTKGERTWKSLWMRCTLNVYLGMPPATLEDAEDTKEDGESKPITGINSEPSGEENSECTSKEQSKESAEPTVDFPTAEVIEQTEDSEVQDTSNTEPLEATDKTDSDENGAPCEVPSISDAEKQELDKIKKVYPGLIKSLVLNMVEIKGGTFKMGSNQGDYDNARPDKECAIELNESPKHEVTLSDYYIGKFPVTQAEWKAVMGYNNSDSIEPKYPVAPVTWDECQDFLRRLSYLVGAKFTLPTEAQWEYAARGGNRSHGYIFSGSDSFSDVGQRDYKNKVGSKHPNELGIYDMSGLVREWCNDIWGYYTPDSQTDPQGPIEDKIIKDENGDYLRVVRSPSGNETVTNRKGESPKLLNDFKSYGFRVVCTNIPDEYLAGKEENNENETKVPVSPAPIPTTKSKNTSTLIGTCSHFSFHSSKNDSMSPESRACAYSVFYSLFNRANYTEYYKSRPYGWKDTALLSAFIYSVVFISWYLIVKFILNERFIGYHLWAVPSITLLYYPLWYIVRLIKIDRMENSLSVQAKIDLFNKTLSQGHYDKAILVCASITAAFTLTFYRFDFLPLVYVMIFGITTNMTLKANSRRWRIVTGYESEEYDFIDEETEVKNPEGDITRTYNWELEKNYKDPNNLHGSLTLYFTDSFVKELRHSNPFYIQRKDKHAKEYILDMFHQMKEHRDLRARLEYIGQYIDRINVGIDEIDPLTKIQFTLDFVQEPNIAYAINEECQEIDMFPDYIRWPEETLYDQKADCNSKALLAAMLFHLQGKNVLYMFSRTQQHAAIGIEFDPRWNDKEINGKAAQECCKAYNNRKYLFCEVTMDGISIGGLLDGMSYDDFEELVMLPLYEPEVDDSQPIISTSSRVFYWDLDSEFGHNLHGTITLEFNDQELLQLRSLNPFQNYGIDGHTYEQNIKNMFKYLNSKPECRTKVKAIADYIKDTINLENLPEIDLVQFTLDFAQAPNITYCVDENSSSINYAKEYMRFPDEVLFDKEGDCDCKSSLTAALFHELGYNVIMMLSTKLGHAAIGIECKEEWLSSIKNSNIDQVMREYNGKNYLYCETTGDGFRIGQIEDNSSIHDFETIVEIKA